MDAPAPHVARNYHSRLEAFFDAASVPDPVKATHRLTARYRTLAELLSADRLVIAEEVGLPAAAVLAGAQDLMVHAATDELCKRQPLTHTRVVGFLKTVIGFRCDEYLVVLFLDARHGLIDHEIVAGGADSVGVNQRRILLNAMGRGATGLIVAHNHPSGDPWPSMTDIRFTRQLADTARGVGICLHDHLVIAGAEVRSAMFMD